MYSPDITPDIFPAWPCVTSSIPWPFPYLVILRSCMLCVCAMDADIVDQHWCMCCFPSDLSQSGPHRPDSHSDSTKDTLIQSRYQLRRTCNTHCIGVRVQTRAHPALSLLNSTDSIHYAHLIDTPPRPSARWPPRICHRIVQKFFSLKRNMYLCTAERLDGSRPPLSNLQGPDLPRPARTENLKPSITACSTGCTPPLYSMTLKQQRENNSCIHCWSPRIYQMMTWCSRPQHVARGCDSKLEHNKSLSILQGRVRSGRPSRRLDTVFLLLYPTFPFPFSNGDANFATFEDHCHCLSYFSKSLHPQLRWRFFFLLRHRTFHWLKHVQCVSL